MGTPWLWWGAWQQGTGRHCPGWPEGALRWGNLPGRAVRCLLLQQPEHPPCRVPERLFLSGTSSMGFMQKKSLSQLTAVIHPIQIPAQDSGITTLAQQPLQDPHLAFSPAWSEIPSAGSNSITSSSSFCLAYLARVDTGPVDQGKSRNYQFSSWNKSV